MGDRLEAFFDEFIDQLLLKDFELILTFNHPYRFRDEIVDLARRISYTLPTMQVIAEEYVAAGIAADLDAGRLEAELDLLAIEAMFGQIGEMFERIEAFRRQLEARVRNTIKYAERGAQGLVGRAGDLVRRLDALLGKGRHDAATLEWSLEPLRSPWSEHQHAPVRQPRRPVEALALAGRPSDPLYEIRKQLRLEYIARVAPQPEEVRRFLEDQVLLSGAKERAFHGVADRGRVSGFRHRPALRADRRDPAGGCPLVQPRGWIPRAAARQRMAALLDFVVRRARRWPRPATHA